ncbi:MAG: PAS domain S-box protein [Polyangiaceae bacterium]
MISLEALQAIVDSLGEAILVVDPSGRPVRWNAAITRFLGPIKADGSWVKRPALFEADETTPIDGEDRFLERALRGEEVTGHEVAVELDAKFVHLATSTRTLRDAAGALVGAIALFRDITEDRRARRALQESVDLHRTLVDHLPSTSVFMFDKKLNVILAGGGQLRGKSLEIVGHPVQAIATPRTVAAYEGAIAGKTTELIVERCGSLFHVQLAPIKDANGEVFAGLMVAEDVTVSNGRMDELQKAKEHLRLTIDNAPIGMTLIGLDGKWIQVNKAFCEIVGYSAETLLTMGWQELTHPDDVAEGIASTKQLLAGTTVRFALPKRYLRKDGSLANIMLHVSLLRDEQGLPLHFITQVVDLSERKKLEEHLILTDRMASIGTLAAGIAHEINNPLSYMTMNLETLAEHLRALAAESTPSPRLTEMLELTSEVRGGADRVRKIVRGMKAFSRPEISESSPLDIAHLADVAIRMVANELRHRARIVRVFGAIPLVDADEAGLTQVLINLLANAAHAIPEGDAANNEIRLSLSTDATGGAVVEVADTGSGISPAILPRIFDPFFTTHALEAGTGLGLSISHGIITHFGGTLTVKSEVGRGSVFRITLPASVGVQADAAATPRVPTPPPAALRRRILIVDDDDTVGRALARSLKGEHDITVLTSARAAAELLGHTDFDFVLCDLMMPDMTGMELHAAVASSRPDIARRFVFLTGGAFTVASREFLDAVPNERFDKPVNLRNLKEFLRGPVASS